MEKRELTRRETFELTLKGTDRKERLLQTISCILQDDFKITDFQDIKIKEEDGKVYFSDGQITFTQTKEKDDDIEEDISEWDTSHELTLSFSMDEFGIISIEIADMRIDNKDFHLQTLTDEEEIAYASAHKDFEEENNIEIDYGD